MWEFPKVRGALIWGGPYNQDPSGYYIRGPPIFGNPHVAAAPYGSLDCWKSVGLEGFSSKESRYVEHNTRACGVNLSLTTTPPPVVVAACYQSRFICWKPPKLNARPQTPKPY